MPKYVRDTDKNRIEISFERAPERPVCDNLKKNGFRWNKVDKYWYAKETPKRLELVIQLCSDKSVLKDKRVGSKVDLVAKRSVAKVTMNKRCCYSSTMEGFLSELRDN